MDERACLLAHNRIRAENLRDRIDGHIPRGNPLAFEHLVPAHLRERFAVVAREQLALPEQKRLK